MSTDERMDNNYKITYGTFSNRQESGMKRTPMATALRTRCAERTRATQLVCVCAYAQVCANTCTVLFTERLCLERHEVQV